MRAWDYPIGAYGSEAILQLCDVFNAETGNG